jgi:site-specific recombinase XerD
VSSYVQHMRWRGLAEGSIEHRVSVLKRCQAAIGKPIREATTEDLLGWLDSKHIADRTRYAYISHLAAFYRWALLEGQIQTDPTLRIPRPKMRLGIPRPIGTDDVLFAVGNAPTSALRAMIVLAAYAGLRCMEIAQLDGGDVLDRVVPPVIVVENGKGGKSRVVPVGPLVIRSLRAAGIRSQGPVFREKGRQMPAWRVSHLIRQHLHDCGIRASAHSLRHTYATQVLRQSGGDLRMTQELLGHSSPTTTSIYAAWAQDKAAEVVAHLYGAA